MPRVSVIVACSDRGTELHENVDAVAAQTFQDFECIVVRDARDGAALPDLLAAKGSRGRVVHVAGSGWAAARNAGLREARSELVCALEAEDRPVPTFRNGPSGRSTNIRTPPSHPTGWIAARSERVGRLRLPGPAGRKHGERRGTRSTTVA